MKDEMHDSAILAPPEHSKSRHKKEVSVGISPTL